MSQLPDAKKETLIYVLNHLRAYNAQIGHYVRSVLRTNFTYSVELDNGHIDVPANLVNDFEEDDAYITEARYQAVAGHFVPDRAHAPQPVDGYEEATADGRPTRRTRERTIVIILVVLAIIFLLTMLA